MSDIDLTAAIEAAWEDAIYADHEAGYAIERGYMIESDFHHYAGIVAKRVRETLAQQIEMEICADTSFATDRVLELAASIVRGQS